MISTFNLWMSRNDKRVENWPLMVTPWPTVVITLIYIIVVTVGPKILKGKTFQIQGLVKVYNLFAVVLNAYIAYELYVNTFGYYHYPCEPVDYTVNERSMRIAAAMWWFWFSKFIEMLDSVFFMLRGKYNQLSFLHIYHHSSMFLIFWIVANFYPGGNSMFGAANNSIIHIIMYTYYFIAALGPEYKKYLGWKKYLTMLQIAQFWLNLGFLLNFWRETCEFPSFMVYLITGYMISFIVLFTNFYLLTYKKKPEKKTE